MTDATPVPLARLFVMAYRYLVDRLHERLRELGWADVSPSFGFVLLAARERSTTATEVALLMRSSKQAASKLLETMEQAGYVRREPDGADARVKVVALTPQGRALLDAVEDSYAELDAVWADVISRDRLEALRSDLVAVLLHAYGGELPALAAPAHPRAATAEVDSEVDAEVDARGGSAGPGREPGAGAKREAPPAG